MPALIAIAVIGCVALGLIYWALVYIARGGGLGGKVFAVVAGAVITGLAGWAASVIGLAFGFAACGGSCL